MTSRKVEAQECLHNGLREKVVSQRQARRAAEEMAREIARFPQVCLRTDRRSVYLRAALDREWANCEGVLKAEGSAGAARFASGAGRHGDNSDLRRPHD